MFERQYTIVAFYHDKDGECHSLVVQGTALFRKLENRDAIMRTFAPLPDTTFTAVFKWEDEGAVRYNTTNIRPTSILPKRWYLRKVKTDHAQEWENKELVKLFVRVARREGTLVVK